MIWAELEIYLEAFARAYADMPTTYTPEQARCVAEATARAAVVSSRGAESAAAVAAEATETTEAEQVVNRSTTEE